MNQAPTISSAWIVALRTALTTGFTVKPRNMETLEVQQGTIVANMRHPIILVRERGLNYSFAAAEALWILAGDNRLKPLTDYNKNMAQFSDDGETLAGAYGPKIVSQLDYVISTLLKDRQTRQAVLTIWERNPGPSKDIPCTVAMSFMIRRHALHLHVFMRSSDLWLGVPYDFFSFSMVAAYVACAYNGSLPVQQSKLPTVFLGNMYLTAASSHLYEQHYEAARQIVNGNTTTPDEDWPPRTRLARFVQRGDWGSIEASLNVCRDKKMAAADLWQIRP